MPWHSALVVASISSCQLIFMRLLRAFDDAAHESSQRFGDKDVRTQATASTDQTTHKRESSQASERHGVVGSIAMGVTGLSAAGVRRRAFFLVAGQRVPEMFGEEGVKIVRVEDERDEQAHHAEQQEDGDEGAVDAGMESPVGGVHATLHESHEG